MELLQQCRDHARKFYGDLLIAAEKNLNESLFEQAEKSVNNEDQTRYFEAIQQLKDRSDAVHSTFEQGLISQFDAFLAGQNSEHNIDKHIDAGTLSLVQRDELEDELAISVIVSKANSRNSESLWKLNQRVAVLRGGKALTDESNPFGPAVVCNALQRAVSQLNLDSKAKMLIYKQLGKIFVISFGKEIDALNDLLTDRNILPNLRFSAASRAASQPAPEPSATNSQPSGEASPTDVTEDLVESPSSIANQQELYGAIRALQAAIGPRTKTAGGVSLGGLSTDGSGGADTFSPTDYALVLSAIQQSAGFLSAAATNEPLPAEQVEQQFVSELTQKGEDSTKNKMSRDDADTLDVVGMIFRYMLDDPNLHDAVKSLLSHLHTPYLKLALMDKTFLDNYEHSARLLLNAMAEVGSKWVKDENDRTVLPKIKTMVENLLKGFIDDVTIFDRLLSDFVRFKDNLEKRARMVEKRNTESQQGLEKLELSKQQAAEEISLRLEKAGIPENITTLLHKPWSDFLAFNLLRHGDDSLTWEAALKVVDGVIWSVRPSEAADNKEDLQRHQTDLEKSVSEGLATIGYDVEASKNLMNALKEAQELAYHRAIMDEAKPKSDKPVDDTSPNTTPDTASDQAAEKAQKAEEPEKSAKPTEQPKPEKKTASSTKTKPPALSTQEQRVVEQLKEIAFGTWFEFDYKGSVRLLKLAWYSRVSAHYMFVDQAGVKQSVEDQYKLAKGMAAGTIRLAKLTKKSFMERALETVLDTLKLS